MFCDFLFMYPIYLYIVGQLLLISIFSVIDFIRTCLFCDFLFMYPIYLYIVGKLLLIGIFSVIDFIRTGILYCVFVMFVLSCQRKQLPHQSQQQLISRWTCPAWTCV